MPTKSKGMLRDPELINVTRRRRTGFGFFLALHFVAQQEILVRPGTKISIVNLIIGPVESIIGIVTKPAKLLLWQKKAIRNVRKRWKKLQHCSLINCDIFVR